MNGQQLTNSSNSANGTPSSSYPASLSSHSSRDPSPTRVNNAYSARIAHKSYTDSGRPYSQNQWQSDHLKSTGNLVNNFSSQNRNPLLSSQHSNFTSTLPALASQAPAQRSSTSNHLSSHGDVKEINDITRPSPQPTPPLKTSLLPSQPRSHVTSPVSKPDPSTNAQIQSSHPVSSQSVSTGVSFSQFRFTQGNSNSVQSLTSSSQNLYPHSKSSNNSKDVLTTRLNQNQPSDPSAELTSKSLSFSQNQPSVPSVELASKSLSFSQNQPGVPSAELTSKSVPSNQNQFPSRSQSNQPSLVNQAKSQTVNKFSSSSQNVSQKQFVPNPSIVQNPNQPKFNAPQPTLIQNQTQPSYQSQRPTITQPPFTQSQFQPLQNQPKIPVSQPSTTQNQPTFQSQFRSPQQPLSQNQFQPPVSQANQNQFHPNTTNQYQTNAAQFQPSQSLPPNLYQQTQGLSRYPLPNTNQASATYPAMPRSQFPQQPNVIQAQPGVQPQPPASDYQQSYYNQAAGKYQMNQSYPQMPTYGGVDGLAQNMAGMSVQSGFNKLWGMETFDLLKNRDVLPHDRHEAPPIRLQHELYEAANCSPEIFRCTLTKIPETKSLLDKSRLPLGVLIHPFKDLNQLSVIQCTVIVRCRVCRTYINPFVYFVDNKRWKCNLCFRDNELPDEFQFDPLTKTYGDPSRRPEIKSATIEFIAPSEYMVRPPQPAIYVFLLDVSRLGSDCGYLEVVCRVLMDELENLPGDARTSVAFITYDSTVHFYALAEGMARPHQMVVVDIEEIFLPCPENLVVNLSECHELIRDLLTELPNKFRESYDTGCAMGAALQAAYKLLSPTGGRITVFQSCLPNLGPGALTVREDPSQRAGENVAHLNPVTDYYKKLALDCSNQQIAVDLFLVNSQYVDVATLSGVSRFSGGCMHHFPLFRSDKVLQVQNLERVFQRYLTRKIGFESVMRLRCTRGLSIHTFHGNFFVRSTDLLSLPNANPDSGFGMQVSIDENLSDVQTVCFQAALLYTSSKGERRIRVHTLCLPVASNLSDILYGADQHCIIGLLAKMAVDRSMQSSLSDAREAFLNVAGDVLSAFKLTQSISFGTLLAPGSLRTLPLLILALIKYTAFRIGQSTRLDDRVFAMCQMKTLPLSCLIQTIYPDLYPVHNLEQYGDVSIADQLVPQPPRLHLSSERVDSTGVYLMDDCNTIMIYVGHNVHQSICNAYFGVPQFSAIPQEMYELPQLENPESERLRNFVNHLQNEKPYTAPIQIIREDSPYRMRVIERLVEDKNETGPSYYEFLQRIKALIK